MKNPETIAVGDIVRAISELQHQKVNKQTIGIVTNVQGNSSIYEVTFQGYPESNLVWDFQIEKLDIQE